MSFARKSDIPTFAFLNQVIIALRTIAVFEPCTTERLIEYLDTPLFENSAPVDFTMEELALALRQLTKSGVICAHFDTDAMRWSMARRRRRQTSISADGEHRILNVQPIRVPSPQSILNTSPVSDGTFEFSDNCNIEIPI